MIARHVGKLAVTPGNEPWVGSHEEMARSGDQRQQAVDFEPLVGVDRPVREHQFSRFTAPDHELDGIRQEARRDLGITELAGAIEIIPGDLDRIFHQQWHWFGHGNKTPW